MRHSSKRIEAFLKMVENFIISSDMHNIGHVCPMWHLIGSKLACK